MKKQIFFLFCLLCSGIGFSQSLSPEVISTAGDHFVTNEVQMSFTIGEIVTETIASDNAILTQGFHQAELIITTVDDLAEAITVSVYPNPTTELVNVELKDQSAVAYLELHSSTGQALLSQATVDQSNIYEFNLTDFAGGTYFLQVMDTDQQTLKTFKIIKSR